MIKERLATVSYEAICSTGSIFKNDPRMRIE